MHFWLGTERCTQHLDLYKWTMGSVYALLGPAAMALAHSWMRSAAWMPTMCTAITSVVSLLKMTWRWKER